MKTICIAGKNDIATNVLIFVAEYFGPERVVAVANRDDSGKDTWQHSLISTAERLGVRLISLEEAYNTSHLHFFSVEFDRIVVPSKFKQAELYNIHFSLLPRYKGVYTVVWPLINGDTVTGVTLHRIEAGIDTGPIIYQEVIIIDINSTSRDIYHKCLDTGFKVLRRFIPLLVEQTQAGTSQPVLNSTYYGPKSIDYGSLSINLRQTSYQIHNAIRAFTFQEYQLPTVLGQRVSSSKPTSTVSTERPGTLLKENDEGFFISTIDFDLYLVKDYSYKLLQAIRQGDSALVNYLLPHISNLEIRTREGWSPLMIAAYSNAFAIVKALVDHGADVNATNKTGTTILMYAKSNPNEHTIKILDYLLAKGANIIIVDSKGLSVLHYAYLEKNSEIIAYLESRVTNLHIHLL